MRRFSILLFVAFIFASPALAVNPDEVLDNPVLEERARDISSKLRCLVCQNQSIDASDAALAKDLRVLVRERLTAGDTDNQIFDYVVDRYGEFVLLQPKMGTHTLVLWFMPIVVLLAGIGIFIVKLRNRNVTKTASLSDEENELILKALKNDE
ncbi:MAG: cytochrome c-type biogenesis protein CcmH [Hyphomicrobiales bacterium]|nr:MAG: cytochrome c-type biogenesis protein CcmH [Hyphomicrobiales bacterium]